MKLLTGGLHNAEAENAFGARGKWEPPFQWGIQDRTSASAKALSVPPLSIPLSPFGTDAGTRPPPLLSTLGSLCTFTDMQSFLDLQLMTNVTLAHVITGLSQGLLLSLR